MEAYEAYVLRLIDARRDKGHSYASLAKEIGCSKSNLYDWEHLKKIPSTANFIAWASALDYLVIMFRKDNND